MQTIPLKDLKKSLGLIGKKVAKGERFIVTKHNQPYIQLVPYEHDPSVFVGKNVGKRDLKPGIPKGKVLPVLEYLLEDREDRF